MSQNEAVQIDVGVCTFRRPYIAETFQSLARQVLPPSISMRVIVADNDITPAAREAIVAAAKAAGLNVDYVHAPARNISIARNACLDYARGQWFAFIDDDETASPHWLASLFAVASNTEADVVFGPVRAIYPETSADWLRQGDFHSTTVAYEAGEIRTGYSGNVLIRRALVETLGLRFDLAAGVAGGEDTLFFGKLWQAGGKLAYAPAACADEPVLPQRATLKWVIKRSFRSGQTHARMVLQRGKGMRPVQAALAIAKTGVCASAVCATLWSRFLWRKWLIRGAMHGGIALGFLGIQA